MNACGRHHASIKAAIDLRVNFTDDSSIPASIKPVTVTVKEDADDSPELGTEILLNTILPKQLQIKVAVWTQRQVKKCAYFKFDIIVSGDFDC